jgi:hypothetical protein
VDILWNTESLVMVVTRLSALTTGGYTSSLDGVWAKALPAEVVLFLPVPALPSTLDALDAAATCLHMGILVGLRERTASGRFAVIIGSSIREDIRCRPGGVRAGVVGVVRHRGRRLGGGR